MADATETPRAGGEVRTDASGERLDNVYAWGGDEAGLRRTQRKYAERFAGRRRVLDVGCGRGFFLGLMRELGIGGAGIDMSEAMVEATRLAGFPVELSEGSAYLERHPGEFDGIFASHVIEHIPAQEGERFIRLAARALAPGGRLIVITPRTLVMRSIASGFWRDLTHQRPYPLDLLEALCESAGLSVAESGPDPDTATRLGPKDWLIAMLRRPFLGPVLHDFLYGPGAHFVVADRPEARG
ncbi:MAG: class I SAM-dependent methyltransferase [Candidatus Eisenbacteria bacterium]|nr:class I SAM-dependent methyltransferase [Candidatus Eisenbacteria bacterium]